MAMSAVRPLMTDAAALSKLSVAGFGATWALGATAYSAKVPALGFGRSAVPERPEHLVARLKVGDLRADGRHDPGDVAAAHRMAGPPQPGAQAQDRGHSRDGGPVRGVDAGGPHPDQDVAGAGRRARGLPEREHVPRIAVAVLEDGLIR